MNQTYDEPMDRVSVSIPKIDHLWVKEVAQKANMKKGTVIRNLLLRIIRQEQTDDRERQNTTA